MTLPLVAMAEMESAVTVVTTTDMKMITHVSTGGMKIKPSVKTATNKTSSSPKSTSSLKTQSGVWSFE